MASAGLTCAGCAETACESAADCDDGLACNGRERCLVGACAPGIPRECDDGVPCTVDTCAENGAQGACTYTPDDTRCDPGFECAPPAGCEFACDSDDDCDDGVSCNGAERCSDRRCVAGTPVACQDGIACTTDRCLEGAGCVSQASDALCTGGRFCDVEERGCVTSCRFGDLGECDPADTTCGCGPGRECALSDDDASAACAPNTGNAPELAACTAHTDCVPGHRCSALPGSRTGPRRCEKLCRDSSQCTDGNACLALAPDGALGVCPGRCDWRSLTNDCPAGMSCLAAVVQSIDGLVESVAFCVNETRGSGTNGALCENQFECSHGHFCVVDGSTGRCRRACAAGPSTCPVGTACVGLVFTGVPADFGACLP